MEKLKRIILKEEYLAITNNTTRALILGQMIYWSERVRDFDKFVNEEIERAKDEGKKIDMPLSKGWIYKGYDKFKSDMMLSDSIKTISRHILKLVEAGFLDRRRNPDYRYDRKYQYRVNLLKIREALNKCGYELQGYKFDFSKIDNNNHKVKSTFSNCQNDNSENQIDNSNNQYDSSYCQVDKAILETISETKIENILESTSTTNKSKENIVDDDNLNLKIKNISSYFSKILNKKPNINDLNTIEEVLKIPIDIPFDKKETLITECISNIYENIRKTNPNKRINSFKYFYQSIIDEFEKHTKLKQDTALKPNEESLTGKDINEFFEFAWSKYPKQEGKDDISIIQKLEIHSIGNEFIRAIERYLKYDKELKINNGWKELQHGKTFFNKGYKEWLDKNFESRKLNLAKSESELKKERILKLLKDNKEAGLL
jgi:DNA-binding MarR family transcriptional regulator